MPIVRKRATPASPMNAMSSGTIRAADAARALGAPRPPEPTAEFPPEELAHALELLRREERESAAPPPPEPRRTRSGERPVVRAPFAEPPPSPSEPALEVVTRPPPAPSEPERALAAAPTQLPLTPVALTLEPARKSRVGVLLLVALLAASGAALALARYLHQI